MNDPISDMLTRIKNSQAVSKSEVFIPFSKTKYEIAQILEKEGFVENVKKVGRGTIKTIGIGLKYQTDNSLKEKSNLAGQPVISGFKRISRPGQRIYLPVSSIRPVRGGFGIAIISTSQGLMTNRTCKKKNLGGEIICQVW